MKSWSSAVLVSLFAFASAGCSAVFSKSASGWTEKEKVELLWEPNESGKNLLSLTDQATLVAKPSAAAVPLVALALEQLITRSLDAGQEAVETEVDAHTASYSVASADVFWKSFDAPTLLRLEATPNYNGFIVRRFCGADVVAQAKFDLVFAGAPVRDQKCASNTVADGGDAFRVRLSKLWYRKSKAKVLDDNVFTRVGVWFGLLDRTPALDVKPEVTIKATRVDFVTGQITEYSRVMLMKAVEGVSIDGDDSLKWNDTSEWPWLAWGAISKTSVGQKHYVESTATTPDAIKAALMDEWSLAVNVDETSWIGALVPSTALGKIWGGAPFSIEVKFTETDSAMSGLEEIKDYLVSKRETPETRVRETLKLGKP